MVGSYGNRKTIHKQRVDEARRSKEVYVHLKFFCNVLALSFFFHFPAKAQDGPVACQVLAAAGLNWENGSWVVARYKAENKFILVLRNGDLTETSVQKALKGLMVICRSEEGERISCSDRSGGFLIFDSMTMQGTIAQTFGGTNVGPQRDSVTVEPFACQKF